MLTLPSRILRRSFAAFGAALLLFSSAGDALAAHGCAHHDALPATSDQHHGTTHDRSDSNDTGCTCVGTCSPTGSALAPMGVAGSTADGPITSDAPSVTPVVILPAAAPYLLPYATAPPTLL